MNELRTIAKRIINVLDLKVDLDDVIIHRGTAKELGNNVRGTCRRFGRKEFVIVTRDDLTGIKLESNLAHELKHVEQYMTGILSKRNYDDIWQGELYERKVGEYYTLPWEVEARGASMEYAIAKLVYPILNSLCDFSNMAIRWTFFL